MAKVIRNLDVVSNPYRYDKDETWLEKVREEMDMILDMSFLTVDDKVRIISHWFWDLGGPKSRTPIEWLVSKT